LYCSRPQSCSALQFKHLEAAVAYLEIDGLAGKRLRQVYDAGYTDIVKLANVRSKKLAKLERWGEKLSIKVAKDVKQSLKDCDLYELMVISNLFMVPGFALASTRLEAIQAVLGKKILSSKWGPKRLASKLDGVDGIGPKAIKCFVTNVEAFRTFHTNLKPYL
jgi:NAD-dependent DNA ligase